jgi:hypothetical protein
VLRPRSAVEKPRRVTLDPKRDSGTRIQVKFRDDLPVRARQDRLDDTGSRVLAPAAPLLGRLAAAGAKWRRQHYVSEEKLAELRANAQRNTGKAMPDLNNAYVLELPPGQDVANVIDALNALDVVEIAWPAPLPPPLPVVPNYEPQQGYLESAPGGIEAHYAWGGLGGTGVDVQIADIEIDWNLNHEDFSVRFLGPQRVVPAGRVDSGSHGTAVLGILGAQRNGFGVTGIAYGSTLYAVAANTASGYDPAAAITTALETLRAGDVIVLEQQIEGPAMGNTDFVPIEWLPSVYNAIVIAVGNGVIVCEAAGNGNQNLDDPIFDTGHRPFKPENDSGAIIVGAGAPPGDSDGDRSRLYFSSYGSTVDLQGWGAAVVTTGYGDLYSSDGTNLLFTSSFGGTSSATPIVAGACALLQAAYKARHGGQTLSPREIRALLVATGSPQLAGTNPLNEHIGPRPNLRRAKDMMETGPVWLDFTYNGSENGSFSQPYNTIPEAAGAVPSGGFVLIKPGSSSWTGTIDYNKTLTLLAAEGAVTIGR